MANASENDVPDCMMCPDEAQWVKETATAGTLSYCDGHARLEMEMNQSSSNFGLWKLIAPHPMASEFSD